MKKTVVIGGGAAGMLAASVAANRGADVTLIERNERLGRKIMITGKGRCNVTNDADLETLMKNTVRNPKFLYSAFSAFSSSDTMHLFENRGVKLKVERGNRVFPISDKAVDIVDALSGLVRSSGVKIVNDRVKNIGALNGAVYNVTTESNKVFSADNVVIATGGMSYPTTGSTGDGFALAERLGHTIKNPCPALVPIVVHEGFCSVLEGLSLRNVVLSLYEEGRKKPVYSELGEMLFTGFGVSGPLALSASSRIDCDKAYKIVIDMKPALDLATLDARIIKDFSLNINRDFQNSLSDLLPRLMIPVVVRLSGIEPHLKVNQVTKEQRQKLISVIKGLTLNVTGLRPIQEAIITRGGVSVKEVSPSTMESKLCKGLFFAGEILDVDALTGGFNLQIAFSTGYLAGNNVEI